MSALKLETHENRTQFSPGDMIEGLAGWELDAPPESVTLYLFWHTTGKGDRDVGVADQVVYDNPAAVDAQIFSLRAPDGPYSYAGRLISITWSLELVVEPGHHVQRLDLTISPTYDPVTPSLTEADADDSFEAMKARFQ